jgi:nucleotidyltransferase/DNA polymerase involved in DNA repair
VLLRSTANLSLVSGVDVRSISGLYATARTNGYRVIDANAAFASSRQTSAVPSSRSALSLLSGDLAAVQGAAKAVGTAEPSAATRALFLAPAEFAMTLRQVEPGDMASVFGALQPWDRYFLGSNGHANWAFHVFNVARLRGYDIHYYDARFGRMFLDNAAHARTFITNAALDLVVYTAALPSALARFTDIVADVYHDTTGMAARPGRIVLSYRSGAITDAAATTERIIRFPLYDRSCHAVSLTQPEDLFTDVSTWLREGGVVLAGTGGW